MYSVSFVSFFRWHVSFTQFGLRVRSFSVYSYLLSNCLVSLIFRVVVCFFGVVVYYPALLIVMNVRLFWPICCHIVVLSRNPDI